MLFKHLREDVENEMGCDDLEVCPNEDCQYNIVQLKVNILLNAIAMLLTMPLTVFTHITKILRTYFVVCALC